MRKNYGCSEPSPDSRKYPRAPSCSRAKRIGDLPPNKRSANTVFQHYALFPNMTVEENVAFGMKMLGMSKSLVADRSRKMLHFVKLGDYATRSTNQLSGGQQQRVALARAMAPGSKVPFAR